MAPSMNKFLVTSGQAAFLVIIIAAITACSRAHVLVLDQNDDPVEGVSIHSSIQPGNAYFSKGKTTIKKTNAKGRAVFPVGKWFEVTYVRKDGYQFREVEQFKRKYGHYIFGIYAKEFNKDNPLVIRAWKRGKVPDLTYISGRIYFPDTIDHCTVEILSPKEDDAISEPIYFRVQLVSDYRPAREELRNPTRNFVTNGWHGSFAVSDASIIDTDDLFMNHAPEHGYSDGVVWGPIVYSEQEPGINNNSRQLFIKSDSGDYYGGAILLLTPDKGTKAAMSDVEDHRVYFQAWFNFNGSTNIMRNERNTVWSRDRDFFYTNYYCREAPDMQYRDVFGKDSRRYRK